MSELNSIPIITGPTASGKSASALELCKIIGGELVSCDSMQIYRGLDIGTAKATKEEQEQVPHHLIDIVEPGENFSVRIFLEKCFEVIEDISSRGKTPVLCGGTGQYISALRDGINYADDPAADKFTELLMREYEENGIIDIYKRLVEVDREAASKIHPNNTRRVIRALAVYLATGKTFTQRNLESKKEGPRYPFTTFMIDYEDRRDILYDRINKRVDVMIEMGLLKEAQYLYSLPIDRKSTCCQAIGYKEFLPYINNEPGGSIERASYEIKLNTRHYAKKQLTWFRYMKNINLINRDISPIEQAGTILDMLKTDKKSSM
ncbi:MAG: tRNA (adenosine(37)-N6)-dimethylallyltransferase MiaA [Saccharofermentans sp.]|nr:tRNA (adenosine(37)-N6)-dimethylallyltransferase MiaA [Saccharofermentans sp.]